MIELFIKAESKADFEDIIKRISAGTPPTFVRAENEQNSTQNGDPAEWSSFDDLQLQKLVDGKTRFVRWKAISQIIGKSEFKCKARAEYLRNRSNYRPGADIPRGKDGKRWKNQEVDHEEG